MIEIKNVQGTQDTVQEIEFNVDTVYTRTNIIRVETEDFVGWQYDEIQYNYKEWIELNSNKISILECENENLKQELALTQDAVNEMLFMMMNMKGE